MRAGKSAQKAATASGIAIPVAALWRIAHQNNKREKS